MVALTNSFNDGNNRSARVAGCIFCARRETPIFTIPGDDGMSGRTPRYRKAFGATNRDFQCASARYPDFAKGFRQKSGQAPGGISLYGYAGAGALGRGYRAVLNPRACLGSRRGAKISNSPAVVESWPPDFKVLRTRKYSLRACPPEFCAPALPIILANCRAFFPSHGLPGLGCVRLKVLCEHPCCGSRCRTAASRIRSAQKAERKLEYCLQCPKGESCCDMRTFARMYRVDITLELGTPDRTLAAVLRQVATPSRCREVV